MDKNIIEDDSSLFMLVLDQTFRSCLALDDFETVGLIFTS